MSVIVNRMLGALHTLHVAASVPECGKISTTNITNMAKARSFVQKVTKTRAAISSKSVSQTSQIMETLTRSGIEI